MATSSTTPTTLRIPWRGVALPAEHGGWGFVFEPLLLGWLLAWTPQALFFTIAVLAIFLLHQPMKVFLKDRVQGRTTFRTQWAGRFSLLYAGVALVTFLPLLPAITADWLWIGLGCAVLIGVQLTFDLRNDSRALLPELAGAAALNASVILLVLLGGWQLTTGLALWGLLLLRTIPSIVYIRARIQQLHHKPIMLAVPIGWLLLAVGLNAIGVLVGAVPSLSLFMPLCLLVRGIFGLAQGSTPMKASQLGFREIGYGVLSVVMIAVAYSG